MTVTDEILRKLRELEARLDDLTNPEVAASVISGSGANTQVAYWTAVDVLAGDAGLTYDAAANDLTVMGDVFVGLTVANTPDTDTYITWPAGDQMRIRAGGATMLDIVEAAKDYINITQGLLFVNETSNANMAQGITADQGANSDEILNFRSSDVGDVLAAVETQTYVRVQKVQAAAGGAGIDGFKDADGVAGGAVQLRGYLAENPSTTKTTAGRAIVEIHGIETDGTNEQNTVANGNVLGVRTQRGGATVSLLLLDEDADLDLPGGRIATGYGDYWDLEDYHAGTVTDTGYVQVDINGTTYQLLTRLPP